MVGQEEIWLGVMMILAYASSMLLFSRIRKSRISLPRGRVLAAQILMWYPLSTPLLFVRAPLIYIFVYIGQPLWVAIVYEFLTERPLFFLTAKEIISK